MKRLLVLIFVMLPCTSFGGEITHMQYNTLFNTVDFTYIDSVGATAVCTVFYNNKPVGANSSNLINGVATVKVSVPLGFLSEPSVTYTCSSK